ncbi:ABC transporter substrate-binding protein [bacterium SCSIO 12741]|nr:ABC transporter substrate-binding protein [bacterium SCSIO 12741]
MHFRDQVGRELDLTSVPKRIVSLVPSITEYLFWLGLGAHVVGVTRFCTHPSSCRKEKAVVGGTKDPDIDKIRELAPDLILANKEENLREHVEELAQEFSVWVSDVYTLEDSFELFREIGKMTGTMEQATTLVKTVRNNFDNLDKITSPKRAAYFIWKEPWMVCGSENFISFLIERAGFTNIYGTSKERYPMVTLDEVKLLQPEVIMLSTEPYPFGSRNLREMEEEFPEAKVIQVDGRLFSWYGSALMETTAHIREIHSSLM